MSKYGDWIRGGMLFLVLMGVAFGLYGRLVRVETRLAALEKSVADIHAKLFPTKVAER